MKTLIKSFNVLCMAAIIIVLSACIRGGSGCSTWGNVQHKKQYHAQLTKGNNNFANYKQYNN